MSVLIRVETSVTLKVKDHYAKQVAVIEMDGESIKALLNDKQLMLDDLVEGHLETAYNEALDLTANAVWQGLSDSLEGLVKL